MAKKNWGGGWGREGEEKGINFQLKQIKMFNAWLLALGKNNFDLCSVQTWHVFLIKLEKISRRNDNGYSSPVE